MAEDERPSPEEMLARAREEEARARRGRLKIFFGASPGVGKTYAMLEAARAKKREGIDVVIGWIETHGRKETETLADGYERIPPRVIDYRGIRLNEFDLDRAIDRRPALILVDEFAHTNAPGSKHARRFQDIDDLLDAGIDVYTTLNVQHLESLNDIVAQTSGILVRETVPDSVFEQADEVELVDIPPDDLLQRLKEGKVYIPSVAERAAGSFFKKGNLIALRELSLQRTAERVDAQMNRWRREEGVTQPWTGRERVLVAIGPAPQSANLIRAAYRMANRLRAPWIALWIETSASQNWSVEDRERINQHLALAQQLGAETSVVASESVSDTILQVARQKNVTRIVVGKPTHARWRDRLRGSMVDELVRGSGPIDVLITTGEDQKPSVAAVRMETEYSPPGDYLLVVGVVVAVTAICSVLRPLMELADQAMLYLLGILFIASRLGRGPSLTASILSVAALDFFFVPPFFTFAVSDTRHILTFGVLLTAGVLMSRQTIRIRMQAETSRERERRTSLLYAMTRSFAFRRGVGEIADAAGRHVEILLSTRVGVLIPDTRGELAIQSGAEHEFIRKPAELAAARWVYDHGKPAGPGTDTLPSTEALYLPLKSGGKILGVIGIHVRDLPEPLSASQNQLLGMFVSQAALAMERAKLAEDAEQVRISAETERMRNVLLTTVSHDVRTPLAAITGAATSLLDQKVSYSGEQSRELLLTIRQESERLNAMVTEILDLTRLESGAIQANREWYPLEEVVGGALARLESAIRGRDVRVKMPGTVVSVPVDPVLIEQVLINLVENAVKYTPSGTPIEIEGEALDGEIEVRVLDQGPGIPPGELDRIFEKFYRIEPDRRLPGTGLGLPICRAILAAHGGRIWAENRPSGGACFRFRIPLFEDQETARSTLPDAPHG